MLFLVVLGCFFFLNCVCVCTRMHVCARLYMYVGAQSVKCRGYTVVFKQLLHLVAIQDVNVNDAKHVEIVLIFKHLVTVKIF